MTDRTSWGLAANAARRAELPDRVCIFAGGSVNVVARSDVPADILATNSGWLRTSVPVHGQPIDVYSQAELSNGNASEAARAFDADTRRARTARDAARERTPGRDPI